MLSFVWNNPTKTEERSREFLLLSIVGLSSNLKLLVAMRLGVTPVPIPNTLVKTDAADNTWLETTREDRWLPDLWGISSVGRAPALQAGGHEFESRILH